VRLLVDWAPRSSRSQQFKNREDAVTIGLLPVMRNKMENDVLKDIVDYATRKLMAAYGFCGVAEGPKVVMLNSSDGQGNDIKINIKLEEE